MLEKMKFPMTCASKCPKCESEKTITRAYIDQLKAEGKLVKAAYPAGSVMQVAFDQVLNSPLMIRPEVPVLQIGYDVCAECFTMYATNVNLLIVPVQIKKQGVQPS